MNDEHIQHIVDGFHNHTLPKPEWTHQAHLIVGLHTVTRNNLEESIRIMRDGIKAYNLAVGTQNTDTGGYHETITILFVHILRAFVAQSPPNTSLNTFVNQLQRSILLDRTFMFQFYTKDVLFSVQARRTWIDPDRQPLANLDHMHYQHNS